MTSRRTLLPLLAAALAAGAFAFAPAPTAGDSTSDPGDVVLWGTAADTVGLCDGFEDASFCTGLSEQGDTTGEPTDPDPDPVLLEPCTNTGEATVVTPETPFADTVPTPIGAANATPAEDAGLYQLDLAGSEQGSTARVRMTLSWDTPALGDYDLVVNGANALSTDSPETHTRTLGHCQFLDLETLVFIGLPTDTLQLEVATTHVIDPIVLETSSEA